MIIRRFEKKDAAAVSALIKETMRVSNAKDYPEEMIKDLLMRQEPENVLERAGKTHFYVAQESGEIIGSGAIGPYEGRKDESCLYSFFVLPAYQGSGVGRRIMEALEQDEFFLSAKRVVIPASITAVEFYRKLGYAFAEGKKELDEDLLYTLEKIRHSRLKDTVFAEFY